MCKFHKCIKFSMHTGVSNTRSGLVGQIQMTILPDTMLHIPIWHSANGQIYIQHHMDMTLVPNPTGGVQYRRGYTISSSLAEYIIRYWNKHATPVPARNQYRKSQLKTATARQ